MSVSFPKGPHDVTPFVFDVALTSGFLLLLTSLERLENATA